MAADTIVAISTALGVGAISIIRLSGDEALPIVSRLTGKDLTKAEGYTIHYGTIKENDEPVDEVLISVFHGPRSYTGEDMAEINCHGGIFITRKVLSLCIAAGPGWPGGASSPNGHSSTDAWIWPRPKGSMT